ncbi:hypothetical protein JN00_0246 [Metamycoplasma subdolum]|uniref:Uncharacterized protein n=1 Tax=Metamycoplasma subdolum TaxID=92407 RepID=A0A3M0A806_9BACT|nr:hypothetical protein [Metamycoplasma subdolum]RMA78605.1 hypothetical protein JN00_0246 [Metamycoplasma subdolum]WPB50260.1 hypothetical protein R9C05_01440 [Metamycoplasma subdolum]
MDKQNLVNKTMYMLSTATIKAAIFAFTIINFEINGKTNIMKPGKAIISWVNNCRW